MLDHLSHCGTGGPIVSAPGNPLKVPCFSSGVKSWSSLHPKMTSDDDEMALN